MMNKFAIFTILFSVTLSSCYRKIVDPYFGVYFTKIDSKVLKLESVSIADTTIALVSGTIYSKDGSDTLSPNVATDAVVIMNDQRSGKIYAILTDINGKFQINLPTSIYNLKVGYTDYQTLVVRDVILQAGEIIEFNAQLGLSIGEKDSSVYAMQADKTIKLISQPIKR